MYAEIAINRRTPGKLNTFFYRVPEGFAAEPCQTVWVPFRNLKIAGVIVSLTSRPPDFPVKEILGKISEDNLLQPWQMELAKHIADYYLCPLSRVLPLFLPKKIWTPPSRTRTKKVVVPSQDDLNKKNVRDSGEVAIRSLKPIQEEFINKVLAEPGGKFLLHGVTGSGKTEIYLRVAKKMEAEGKQSLILVPEIALTPQLIEYLQKHFEQPIAIIHSKLTEKERRETWLKIFRKESVVIVGSRSALFSPFQNLGLIVMDEEHEWTYKQDQTPRYHARNVAEKMAALTGSTLVLGSATPSLESYYEAETGRYSLLHLPDRIEKTPMPKTIVVDMRNEIQNKNFGIFSDLLKQKLAETLAKNKQTILFMNRRGISSATLCRDCGYVVKCPECHVAMVTHKLPPSKGVVSYKLICHHCGLTETPPMLCPECQSHKIRWMGGGTQQVEEEVKKLFGLARVYRADRDTIAKKQDYEDLYVKLKNHDVDIVIGTQMVAKGLDIPHVHLVGAIMADTSLHFPDFRASEKTFQLLTQVSGRAGRNSEQGEVVIQTYSPEHPAIVAASLHDYEKFYREEIRIRKEAGYPPFSKIIKLTFSHPQEKTCQQEAEKMEASLKAEMKKQGLTNLHVASCPAMIPYQFRKFHWQITLRGANPEAILKPLLPLVTGWKIDVDPIS